MKEPTLPTIEELHDQLAKLVLEDDDASEFFSVYRIQAQTFLLIALELEQINNNLEVLRKGDRS